MSSAGKATMSPPTIIGMPTTTMKVTIMPTGMTTPPTVTNMITVALACSCAGELRQGVRDRHLAQHRAGRCRSNLRISGKLDRADGRRRTQSERRFRTAGRLGCLDRLEAAAERPFTYGLRGSSILAALANAVFLLVATGAIGWESIQRFSNSEPIAGITVMVVATLGIVVNGVTALLFGSGRKGDINIQGAFLHMAGDAAVSAGVVISAALILSTGWLWLDPAMSLVICAVILVSTWGLLRGSVDMSLSAVPESVDLSAMRIFLLDRPGVTQMHDLHVWPISTTETAMTCHLVMLGGHPGDDFLIECCQMLKKSYKIGHATLQIEVSEDNACSLAPDDVV